MKMIQNTNLLKGNSLIQPRIAMIFIFLMFTLTIFNINFTSGFEFDNVKNYDEDSLEITVENLWGFGKNISKIKLNTPLVYNVIDRGEGIEQLVAEYTIENFEDYPSVFNDMEFYDVKNGGGKINRPFTYKYKVITGQREIPITEPICNNIISGNGSVEKVCYQEQIGINFVDIFEWNNLDTKKELLAGNITIGIFTDVKPNERIEWIPTLFGVKIDEWAVWTDSMNVNLTAYWSFTGNEGLDVSGSGHNLTNSGTSIGIGIIGDGTEFSSGDKWTIIATDFNFGETDYAVNVWINATISTVTNIIGTFEGGPNRGWTINIQSSDLQFFSNTPGVVTTSSNDYPNTGNWEMYTAVGNRTKITIWRNGVVVGSINRGNINDGPDDLGIGVVDSSLADFTGTMDEISVWNRSISESEISDLYNGGAGITFIQSLRVTLNSPVNNINKNTSNLTFNCSATGSKVVNLSLIIDGIINTTIFNSTANQNLSLEQTLSFADGDYNWTCNAFNDGEIEETVGARIFSIDTNFPIIIVTSPIGDQGTFVSGINLTLSWNISDINLDTCFYDYAGSNTTVTCSDNSTNLTVTNSGLTSLTFYANDTAGNQDSTITTWSYSFIEQNVIYNINVSETSLQTFTINMTTSIDVLSISSFLHYNDTDYLSTSLCSGNNCTLTNTFDSPLVLSGESQINSFHWNITIFNGTDSINLETSSRNQNVSRIHLETCDATFTDLSLNFTTQNEINLTRVNPFRFDGTFDIWTGSGTIKRNNSISNSSTNEVNLCMSPINTTFADGQIEYNEVTNITFVTRNYYFQNNTIKTINENITLFLLPSASSTTFILKVQDDNILPLEDHIILIQRYYPGENKFRTIQISKTDDNGKTLGFFETETVDYRFIIMKDNKVLLTTSKQKIFGEDIPFTLTFTIGEDLGKPWKELEDLSNITFNLFFNKTTNVVTYTYADSNTDFTLGRLVVEKLNLSFSSNTIICNLNSSLSSATLICDVGTLTGNKTGTYIASGLTIRSGIEILIDSKSFILETMTSIIGLLGVFMAFFIILISSFAFKFNEIAGIFMINASIIFVNIIGLVSFGSLAITAIIAVSIIIVAVIEK